jgi:hypothetical protein
MSEKPASPQKEEIPTPKEETTTSAAPPAAPSAASTEAAEGEDVESGASEEPQAYFEPVVKLDEVEVVSGEEDEEIIFKM